jgi:hypothetical protein
MGWHPLAVYNEVRTDSPVLYVEVRLTNLPMIQSIFYKRNQGHSHPHRHICVINIRIFKCHRKELLINTFFNAFHNFVLDKYVYYCKPSNATNLCNQASANKLVVFDGLQ